MASKKPEKELEAVDLEMFDTLEEVAGSLYDLGAGLEEELPMVAETEPAPGEGGIADLIVDIAEDVENLTWLIYGDNGTGKTTLLSTVDGMLVLAADEGTLSIRKKTGKIKKLLINSWERMEQVYYLLKGGRWEDDGIYIPTMGGEFHVKSLGFDTLTKTADVCMRNVVLGGKADKDVINPTLKDWGTMGQRMKYWLLLFKELPVQKVWLMQERMMAENIDSETLEEVVVGQPDINNMLRNFVKAEADVIGRSHVVMVADGEGKLKPQYRVTFGASQRFVTKDRTGDLPHTVANPRLDKLYAKVFGK